MQISFFEFSVTPSPEPTTFQIWWAVVGAVVAVLLALLLACLIIIIIVFVRKKKRKKVLLYCCVLSNILSCDSHMIRCLYACQVLPITDAETGDPVSQDKGAIGDEVATNVSGSSGSDLNITRAKSLEVLVPKGKQID